MRIYQSFIAGFALVFAPVDSAGAGGQTLGPVAEIVTFKQADGITDTALIMAAKGTEAFVKSAPGFLSRTLSKGEDGTWTDYVIWADMDAARTAGQAAMAEASFAPFMAAIAPDSVTMRHEPVAWSIAQ